MQTVNIVKWNQAEELPVALAAAFADDFWPLPRALAPSFYIAPWGHPDEIPAAPVAPFSDDAWFPRAPSLERPAALLWNDDGTKGFTTTVVLDDGDYRQIPYALPSPTVVVWAEPEDLPRSIPALLESEWLYLRPFAPAPFLRVWQDVDSAVPIAATPLPVDELYWPPQPVQRRTIDLRVWATTDELVPPPAPLPIDELYWQAPPVQPRVRDLRLWQVEDEITQPPVPLQIDDDAGLGLRWPLWAAKVAPFQFWDSGEFRSLILSLKAIRDPFMANRVQVMPKTPSEAREELLDFGPYLVPGQQVNGGTALCIVYSGTDPNPSALVGTCTVSGTQVAVPLLAAGLSGVIYAVTVYASTSNPAEQIPLCFFLAVVPEAL